MQIQTGMAKFVSCSMLKTRIMFYSKAISHHATFQNKTLKFQLCQFFSQILYNIMKYPLLSMNRFFGLEKKIMPYTHTNELEYLTFWPSILYYFESLNQSVVCPAQLSMFENFIRPKSRNEKGHVQLHLTYCQAD